VITYRFEDDLYSATWKGSTMALPYPATRTNPFTGRKVYISPARQNRGAPKTVRALHPEVHPEKGDVFADPESRGEVPVLKYVDSETDEWRLMVLPNLYPSLSHAFDEIPSPVEGGEFLEGYRTEVGIGFQDLLIWDYPTYTFADFSLGEAWLTLRALAERANDILEQDPSICHFSIFQNYGSQAGETIPHPHIQMYATQHVPLEVAHRMDRVTSYYLLTTGRDQEEAEHLAQSMNLGYKPHGKFLTEDLCVSARKHKQVVYENGSWQVSCPFTPEVDYEMQILPRYLPVSDQGIFLREMRGEEVLAQLADALVVAMRCLRLALDDPPYNILFRLPATGTHDIPVPWYIDVRPAINYAPFGHKQISGDDIVSVDPVDAATLLRRYAPSQISTVVSLGSLDDVAGLKRVV